MRVRLNKKNNHMTNHKDTKPRVNALGFLVYTNENLYHYYIDNCQKLTKGQKKK